MTPRLILPPATVNAFRRNLPRWYRRHRRKLPWRRTRDPYRIWVSEIMLQQTRVEVVVPYYRRWVRALPTLESLARAPYRRVLKLWEGLGYYQRARNLHRAAKLLLGSAGHSGAPKRPAATTLPACAAQWRRLPGVGRYTAGAIASIAFGERVPAVDGNAARVLSRVFGLSNNRSLWRIAERLLPRKNCAQFNQALMELGALVCTPSRPRCERCPLRRVCATRGDAVPVRKPRRLRPVTEDVVLVCRNGTVLLRRRPESGLLAGFWELPPGRSRRRLLTLRHTISNRRVRLRVHAGALRKLTAAMRWFSLRKLDAMPMPAAHRRALMKLGLGGQPQPNHR